MNITIAGAPLIAFLLASLRIAAWLMIVPPFSTKSVPSMVKAVLSVALAFPVAGSLNQQVPTDTAQLAVIAVTQVVIGAAMGFVTYLIFAAAEAAGSLIDTFGGFALTQAFDPMAMTSNAVFAKLHQQMAMTLLFISGGHLLVIGGLLRSFDILPLGADAHLTGAVPVLQSAVKLFFVSAIQIALPMVAVLVVADFGLAMLTKVAPSLNAINVMFPAKIALVLLLLGLSFPVLPGALDHLVGWALDGMGGLASAFASPSGGGGP